MTRSALRRGWCPGAYTPMATGDGLLMRVRPRAGRYALAQLSAVADAASKFGNGEIDLTNRANLQIRGLCEETFPFALEALSIAGLIDADPAAEAIRNVIVSPLAGLAPDSVDVHRLAAALDAALSMLAAGIPPAPSPSPQVGGESRNALGYSCALEPEAIRRPNRDAIPPPLRGRIGGGESPTIDVVSSSTLDRTAKNAQTALTALPHKFGFAIEAEGALLPPGASADVRLTARATHVELRLGGEPHFAASISEDVAISSVLRLVEIFMERARENPSLRRMRDAVAAFGAEAMSRDAGLTPSCASIHSSPRVTTSSRRRPGPTTNLLTFVIGVMGSGFRRDDVVENSGGSVLRADGRMPRAVARSSAEPAPMPVGALGPEEAPWAVGVGLPYGRITARALAHLTQAAARAGAGHARPSPSRALVFVLDGGKADVLLDAARECGLILDANDPRLKMDVCPGSPACLNGTTSTRGDADALAEVLREVPFSSSTVHVSGCAKGCARRGPADLTLVARNGFYDVIRDDGVNGAPLASRIASEDLPDAIRRLAGGAHA